MGAHSDGIQQLLDAAGVRPGCTVLDVACGPGLVSLAAAARGASVTGVDVTHACVRTAQAAARAAGHAAATFVVAPAEALPLPDAAFNVVPCRYALHHLTAAQQAAAVGEVARVAAPGGVVALADVAVPDVSHARAYDALERLRDSSHAGVVRGGGDGMAALLRRAGLTRLAGRCYTYPFTAAAEQLLAASFPEDPASGDAWLALLRVHGPAGRLGVEVEGLAGEGLLRYAVPIAVEVACKPP